jgi:hypothetical protein
VPANADVDPSPNVVIAATALSQSARLNDSTDPRARAIARAGRLISELFMLNPRWCLLARQLAGWLGIEEERPRSLADLRSGFFRASASAADWVAL